MPGKLEALNKYLLNALEFMTVSKHMETQTLAEYAQGFIVKYEVYVSCVCVGNVHCLILLNSLEQTRILRLQHYKYTKQVFI